MALRSREALQAADIWATRLIGSFVAAFAAFTGVEAMRAIVILFAVAFLSACGGSGVLRRMQPTNQRIGGANGYWRWPKRYARKLGRLHVRAFACSAVVTLTVSASAAGESGIALASAQEIEITSGATRAENRGNTVEVAMYNAACLPDGTLGQENPASIGAANIGMTAAGAEPAAIIQ